jgi:translation elongation factor EF-1beta
LVGIEIMPCNVKKVLMALWKKVTTTINQDGVKWGESCTFADVAFGIKKIECTFVMGVKNSSDDVVDAILEMEDEVQSCEVTCMNVIQHTATCGVAGVLDGTTSCFKIIQGFAYDKAMQSLSTLTPYTKGEAIVIIAYCICTLTKLVLQNLIYIYTNTRSNIFKQ